MNADNFAEWQKNQGHKVIRTPSSYWCEAAPRVLQAFPYHWLITPAEKELRDLLLQNHVLALRYSAPLEAPFGKLSYHVVFSGDYSIDNVWNKERKSVLKGLSCTSIHPIPFSQMASQGWQLQSDTLKRQGRTKSMSQADWEKMCHAADAVPGFEAWGAFVDDELAAGIFTVQIEDHIQTLFEMSRREFMRYQVNPALFYTITREFLARDGINCVFFTVESLDAPKNVDHFKFRLGFKPKPVRQRIVFHPLLRPLANRFSNRMMTRLLNFHSDSQLLSKANGMLRFYLEGCVPISEQEVPECLNCPNPAHPTKD